MFVQRGGCTRIVLVLISQGSVTGQFASGLEYFVDGPVGGHLAGFDGEDFVGDGAGLLQVVGDPDAGEVTLADEGFEQGLNAAAGAFIERGGGLVKQKHFGLVGEGAGDGNPLGFSSGEREGVALGISGEADLFQEAVDLFRGHGLVALRGAVGQVFRDGTRKEVGALHHHAHAAAELARWQGLCIHSLEQDLATSWLIEAIEKAEECTFACAAGADDGEDLSALQGEGDIAQECARLGRGKHATELSGFEHQVEYFVLLSGGRKSIRYFKEECLRELREVAGAKY